MKIPFNKPFTIAGELANIAEAVRDGHLAGDGRFTRQCHAWLERHLGARKALLTHSCTAALEMSAILCDLAPGDEVIMPSFTFVSTANAFVLRGAVPVFVDIRRDTLNLDETLIEAAVTPRTRAIVPVHYAGVACEMDAIMAIAARHGLVVVEDAAQGILAEHDGRKLGAIGHLGCLSFHETKNVISGEGGALLVNDERFVARAEIVREKGTNRSQFFRGEVDKYTWVDIGSSYLPSELVGAFLWAQLEHAAEINARRLASCAAYRAGLADLAERGLIELPRPAPAAADRTREGDGPPKAHRALRRRCRPLLHQPRCGCVAGADGLFWDRSLQGDSFHQEGDDGHDERERAAGDHGRLPGHGLRQAGRRHEHRCGHRSTAGAVHAP